ncbi:Thioredoxin-like protein AAED1, chloroplastic isoform B [Glycine soja]|uniref:Thioredoxin-like protein AAED1, chloroplastic isoform B n=1 Tax=Glycine soja TaxID=3848 RepID=A0A445LD75_GLYSO|nr:Thioredoxin-like protein AAED1, chloroplastic isoform B [Glycine soja]
MLEFVANTLYWYRPNPFLRNQNLKEDLVISSRNLCRPHSLVIRGLKFCFWSFNHIYPQSVTPQAGLKIIQLYLEGYRQHWKLSFEKDTVSRGGWIMFSLFCMTEVLLTFPSYLTWWQETRRNYSCRPRTKKQGMTQKLKISSKHVAREERREGSPLSCFIYPAT